MLRDLSWQATFTGLLAAFVGFASTFAVILQGLTAVGANETEAASGLFALTLAMGILGVCYGIFTREPVSVAWSLPGAVFLTTTGIPQGGYPVAIGAFLVCGLALTLSGLWPALRRIMSSIPASLANAMLAGLLINLCFAPFQAIAFNPLFGLPIVLAWLVVGAFSRTLAVPAALGIFVLIVTFFIDIPDEAFAKLSEASMPTLVWTTPNITLNGVLGIAIPLYIVTMASQNIPGIAVMKSNGYPLRPGLWFTTTGIGSFLAAPFGAIAVNLAAVTAAICAGEEAHADKNRRYWTAIWAGISYSLYGLSAGFVTAFVTLAPPILIQAVAGLALIGTFTNSAMAAFQNEGDRQAAAVTFLMTASGITIAGISGAFWGLIAGIIVMGVKRFRA